MHDINILAAPLPLEQVSVCPTLDRNTEREPAPPHHMRKWREGRGRGGWAGLPMCTLQLGGRVRARAYFHAGAHAHTTILRRMYSVLYSTHCSSTVHCTQSQFRPMRHA